MHFSKSSLILVNKVYVLGFLWKHTRLAFILVNMNHQSGFYHQIRLPPITGPYQMNTIYDEC